MAVQRLELLPNRGLKGDRQRGWLALLIAVVLTFTAEASQLLPITVRQELSYREIFFTKHQTQTLINDYPLRDLAINSQYLWLLGKHYLWHFDFRTHRLRRFDFSLTVADNRIFLSRDREQIYLASAEIVFDLAERPRIEYLADKKLNHQLFDFVADQQVFIWFTNDGARIFNRQDKSWSLFRYPLIKNDQVIIAPQRQVMWLLRGKTLSIVNKSGIAKPILTAKDLELQRGNDSLYVKRTKTVLRYSYDGRLLQVIPIKTRRRLTAMHLSNSGHSYLFNDGLFEYYRLDKKLLLYTKLDRQHQSSHLDVFASRLALLNDGRPQIFVLKKS